MATARPEGRRRRAQGRSQLVNGKIPLRFRDLPTFKATPISYGSRPPTRSALSGMCGRASPGRCKEEKAEEWGERRWDGRQGAEDQWSSELGMTHLVDQPPLGSLRSSKSGEMS